MGTSNTTLQRGHPVTDDLPHSRHDRTGARDAEFSDWLAGHQQRLLRTAWALTGNQHDAADLAQTTAAKLYLNWDKVRDHQALDAWVRRTMVNEHNSLWRRAFKRRERSTTSCPRPRSTTTTTTGRPTPCGSTCTPCRRASAPWWCCATTNS